VKRKKGSPYYESKPDLVATSLMKLPTEMHGVNVAKGCDIRLFCDFVAVSSRFPFVWHMMPCPWIFGFRSIEAA